MSVKSNIRERRQHRVKQIMASGGRPATDGERLPYSSTVDYGHLRSERAEPVFEMSERNRENHPDPVPMEEGTEYRRNKEIPERVWNDDPEAMWKRQERELWMSLNASHFGPPQLGQTVQPEMDGGSGAAGGGPSFRRGRVLVRLALSAVLFAGVWFMFRLDHPYADTGKRWVTAALTKQYDFAAAAAWYEREFRGLPAILPTLRQQGAPDAQKANSSPHSLYPPVKGSIVEMERTNALGVTLQTAAYAAVVALDTGRVASVTSDGDRGNVVVIQHANGLQSTYGWLSDMTLKKNDWVEGGERIGSVTTDAAGRTGKLYVAIQKGGRSVPPSEVVAFD